MGEVRSKVTQRVASASNVGQWDPSSPDVGTGMVADEQCGDVIRLQVRVRAGRVERAVFKTFGSPSAIAASSYVAECLEGQSVEQADPGTPEALIGELGLPERRHRAAELAIQAGQAALADFREKRTATCACRCKTGDNA